MVMMDTGPTATLENFGPAMYDRKKTLVECCGVQNLAQRLRSSLERSNLHCFCTQFLSSRSMPPQPHHPSVFRQLSFLTLI